MQGLTPIKWNIHVAKGGVVDLSIVIVSYNTKGMLRDCLNAIPAAVSGLKVETFVVDNNSPDGSADMTESEFPEVHLIRNAENAGFTKANNQALKLCTGRNVVILNPDTEAKPFLAAARKADAKLVEKVEQLLILPK